MIEGDATTLPHFVQDLLIWSDSYWYSALRIIAFIGGSFVGLGILFGVLLRGWPVLIRNPIAVAAILLGPFAPVFLAQIAPLTACQTWAVAVGRKLVPITCDFSQSTGPALFGWTEEQREALESNPAFNTIEAIQAHWLYQVVVLVIFLIIAREALLELYRWIKAKGSDAEDR